MMKQSRCRPVFHSTGVRGTGVMLFPYSEGTETITLPFDPDEQKKADG